MIMMFIKLGFTACLFIFLSNPAHAYLDPGSGSFIFQLAIGAILGGLVTIKFYFRKIKSFITGIFKKQDKHESEPVKK